MSLMSAFDAYSLQSVVIFITPIQSLKYSPYIILNNTYDVLVDFDSPLLNIHIHDSYEYESNIFRMVCVFDINTLYTFSLQSVLINQRCSEYE